MEQDRFKQLITQAKLFLIEQKNRKLIISIITAIILLILSGILLIVLLSKHPSSQEKENLNNIKISPKPLITTEEKKEETIESIGYNLSCQIVITTSLKKTPLRKLNRCSESLNYKISPSKKFAIYLQTDGKKTTIYSYSLENNVEALIDTVSLPIVDLMFDQKNNLAILHPQTFIYYFIPLLFADYPGNYNLDNNTFTDISKKKILAVLPTLTKKYARIIEKTNELSLVDDNNNNLYTISYKDLEAQLTPTPVPGINKESLQWDKRIFFFSDNKFKTIDLDGNNEITHQFICDGVDVVPINFNSNLFTRSPDGKLLAFLIPTENQMRDNPNWKAEILANKKLFDSGQIVLFDLTTDQCQIPGISQTIQYQENFSFSPNGTFLAYVYKGVNLYNLETRQDYQLVKHDPSDSLIPSTVVGSLIWDGESNFIFTLVDQKLVRIYFNDQFEGKEQEIITLPLGSLYAVSPDSKKILYKKEGKIFKYDINDKTNSLFKADSSVEKINQLVWLRNNMIVSNVWAANENLYFTNLPESINFQIDFNGETLIYNSAALPKQIKIYDLMLKKNKYFNNQRIVEGQALRFFY